METSALAAIFLLTVSAIAVRNQKKKKSKCTK